MQFHASVLSHPIRIALYELEIMLKIHRFLFPFFYLWLVGCSVVPNELNNAERMMETHPDFALRILKSMKPDQTKSESNRALYGLLLFQALDKNYKPLQPDSIIDFSINYYVRTNDKPRLASCYFYKGRMCKNALR